MASVHSRGSLTLSESPITATAPTVPASRKEGRGDASGIRSGAATATSPSSSTLKAPKLRDSCDACAAAKVRCTKKKPTCSRCEKRGLHCEYIATKRAGRPSQASTKSPAKMAKPSHDPLTRELSEARPVASPSSLVESSPTTSYQESLPQFYASTDPTATPASSTPSSSLTAFSAAELDDFFASLTSFPELETPAQDILSLQIDCSDTTALMHEDTFSIAKDTCSDMHLLTNAQNRSGGPSSIMGYMESIPALQVDSPCSCLITVLGSLKELRPTSSEDRTLSGGHISEEAGSSLLTIQSVIVENERTVEAMDHILQCPCSQDGYLLTVVSLVVFKVLDWYAAATQVCHIRRHSSSQSVNGVSVESEDAGRVAAQMVLSELHRTQRLVNQLSARFKGHGSGGVGLNVDGTNNITETIDVLYAREGSWPFSTTMLDQLEADLRSRLRAVSSKLVDMLRRG